MAEQNKNVILIFVKNPIEGQVKTRLAKTLGDSKALEVYQKLTQITKNITVELSCDRHVWYSHYVEDDMWDEKNYSKFVQQGENLGKRMLHAFRMAFDTGFEKVIIIGSDCADLTPDIINRAFTALENHGAVIGPSEDGGYYLLGMSQYYPFLFENKTWSHNSVLKDTVKQLDEHSISCYLLPELNDIDTEADLKKSSSLNYYSKI